MLRLGVKALLSLVVLAAIMGVLLFGLAGTLHWRRAWIFLAVFTGISAILTLDLARRDPDLLARRMRGGPLAEKEPAQRVIMWFVSAGFVLLLAIPALDARRHWTSMPLWLALLGDAMVAVGFGLIGLVYRANSYTSATIGVEPGQRVVTTGPYAIVRHPMYASALIFLSGMPLALGSWWGFAPLVAMLPFLIWRLLDEERMLARDLPGYEEYRRKVRDRLIPTVW